MLLHMNTRDRAPRAADRVETRIFQPPEPACAFEMAIDDVLQRALVIGLFHQPQRPDRQGRNIAHPAVADRGKLDTAAAEIADHTRGIGNASQHAKRREPSLFRTRKNTHADGEALLDVVDEFGAVLGIAHRCRCQHIDARRAGGAGQRDEALQIGLGERDTLGAQPIGLLETAAEAAHDLLVEQRPRRAARPVIDNEAERIRTDIDDRNTIGLRGRFDRRCGAAVRHTPKVSAWSFRRQDVARPCGAATHCRGPRDSGWS